MLTAVDLFAGAGGATEGARKAGVQVLVSANHWPVAVETHRANHPEVEHKTQDLQQANFYEWPSFDILLASPACQGHSKARGEDKPHHDATRSTAWAVVACVEAKQPKAIVVENVPDFLKWKLFPQWKSCLETLGYVLSENVLDAADVGVPQNRRRAFIVGTRLDIKNTPTIISKGNAVHVPASTIIGSEGNWSQVNKPARSQHTLAQINAGRAALGGRFLIPYYGRGSGETGRSLDRPLGTVTTRDRYALVDGDRMRMLTAGEYRKAMGFRDDYLLPKQHKLAVHLLGNAVCPDQEAHVLSHITPLLN